MQSNMYCISQICLLTFCIILLLSQAFLRLCNHVQYFPFNANLTLCRYKKRHRANSLWKTIIPLITMLILTENPEIFYHFLLPNILDFIPKFIFLLVRLNIKTFQNIIFVVLSLCLFGIASEQMSQIFCLLILQTFYSRFLKITPWLPGLLIILANDIHVNPGPRYQDNFFQFHGMELKLSGKR